MADSNNIPQTTLNAVVSYLTSQLFTHLTVGTGSTPITLTTSDIANAVQIESSGRNTPVPSGGLTTDNNFFNITFKLTGSMPVSQPVDLRQIGLMTGASATSSLKWGHTLAVNTTKDSNSQWNLSISGRVIEVDTTEL